MKKSEYRLIVAFCNLLMEKQLDSISIQDIYTTAGVSRSSFYNYFKSREQFIDATISFAFDRITTILNQNLLFDRVVMTEMLTFIQDNKEIYYSLATSYPDIDNVAVNYITDMIVNSDIDNLEQQLEEGYKVPDKFALEIYVLTIKGIIFTWIKDGFKESVDTVADMIYTAVAI